MFCLGKNEINFLQASTTHLSRDQGQKAAHDEEPKRHLALHSSAPKFEI